MVLNYNLFVRYSAWRGEVQCMECNGERVMLKCISKVRYQAMRADAPGLGAISPAVQVFLICVSSSVSIVDP